MAKQPKPKKPSTISKPKEGVATKIMKGPGTAFAKGMGYVMNKAESAGKALRAKIHEGTKPMPKSKPKTKVK